VITGDDALYQVASKLVTEISADLANTVAGVPERACVVPAAIAWDECECGLLAVALAGQFLSDNFPSDVLAGGQVARVVTFCDLPWLVGRYAVQLIRCAPTPNAGEISIPCDRLASSAKTVVIDAKVLINAVSCTLRDMMDVDDIVDYHILTHEFLGPMGGCVGSELIVTVAVPRN